MLFRPAAVLLTLLATSGVHAAWSQQPASRVADSAQPLTGRALSCEGGRIKSFECQNVELLSYLPANAIGGAGAYDIWGWTDSTTSREFIVIGGSKTTAFVEVTDPVNPKFLGTLPLHQGSEGITGIKVYKNHAFVVAEGAMSQGMQVFDLTQLRDVKSPPVIFQETVHYDNLGSAHTLILNPATGFAYAAGSLMGGQTCGSGLHMIDVRTPIKPTFAGCYTDGTTGLPLPGYIHDAQCVVYHGPDQQYKGKEICITATGSDVGIVDVTDKKNPKSISVVDYPNASYPHQGWFTEDQRYFFLDDELDDGVGGVNKTRTIVFDLNDLDDPVVLTEFYGTTDATDHNLYIRGRYMYQSNYTAGLRIIDVVDPKNPKEVGYFDTAPTITGPGVGRGTWSNYPFLKSGVVAVANRGLFLVRLRSPSPQQP